MEKTAREEKLALALRSVIAFAVIALLVFATLFTFLHYLELSEARTTLYRAKTVKLAAWAASAECVGTGQAFSDMGSETGFAEGVPEKIRELSGCEGTFRLLRTTDKGFGVAGLIYAEDEFAAVFTVEDGADVWHVYKNSELIEP